MGPELRPLAPSSTGEGSGGRDPAREAGSGTRPRTHLQVPVDLLNKTPGLLQVVGEHQLPLHDHEGHLGARGEVKVLDGRQGDGSTGFVFHALKLHQFHGGDGLGGDRERETGWNGKSRWPALPWSWRPTVPAAWFQDH